MYMKIFLRYGLLVLLAWIGMGLSAARAQSKLWGMTASGGANFAGAIFTSNVDGSGLNVVYSFSYNSGGNSPQGGLTESSGLMYGVTSQGGANYAGTLFSYDTAAGIFTELHDFNGNDGSTPYMEPTKGYTDGKLYGVTNGGGANGGGVIYSFDPGTGIFAKLYDLPAGTSCTSALTLYNNKFYALSWGGGGGAQNVGMLFSYDPNSNSFADLYDYPYYIYSEPPGQMVVYNNVLYGVNNNNSGELFSYNATTGAYATLVEFGTGTSTYGSPNGIVLLNNMFYGVALFGGVDFQGGLFSFNPANSAYSELLDVTYADGQLAAGNIAAYNGNLYGLFYNKLFEVNLTSLSFTSFPNFTSVSPFPTGPAYSSLTIVTGPDPVGTTPQTITFSDMTRTYGDADFSPGATTSSGLGVSYVSSDPTIAQVIGGRNLHIVGAGACMITAVQGGNITYDSTSLAVNLTVNPTPLSITVNDTVKNQLQPNPVFRLTYTGFVYSDGPGSLATPPVISTTATQASPQGTYEVDASGAVSPNYTISYQPGTLTIIGQYQTITLGDIAKNYGDPDFNPGATATSGLGVTYVSGNTSVATVNADGTLHIVGIGVDTITTLQPGDADWASTSLKTLLTVSKAQLTIIVDNKTKVAGQPDPGFTATFNGLVYADDSSNIGAMYSSTDTASDAHPGDYLINVALGPVAAGHYSIVSYSSGILSITPAGGAAQNSLDAYFSSPTSLQANVWMTGIQTGLLQVYDLGGRQLLSKQVSLLQGYNTFTLPVSGWASGAYIVRLSGDGFKLTQTILKIN
jgi:uncharacterized repeat protein (TIGR03803 family)